MPRGVGDPPAVGGGDVRLTQAPFARHRPVEDRRTGRNLADLERDLFAEDRQALSHAIAGEAARDREEPRGERMQLGAGHGCGEAGGRRSG